jgi:hypothetical protein
MIYNNKTYVFDCIRFIQGSVGHNESSSRWQVELAVLYVNIGLHLHPPSLHLPTNQDRKLTNYDL